LRRLFQDGNGYWLHELVNKHLTPEEIAAAHANFAAVFWEPALLRIFTPFTPKSEDDDLDEFMPAKSLKSSHGKRASDASVGSKRGSDASVGSRRGSDASAGSKPGLDASVGAKHGVDTSVGAKHGVDTSVGSKRALDASAVFKRAESKRDSSSGLRRRLDDDSHGEAGGSDISSFFNMTYKEEIGEVRFFIIIL